VLPADPEGGVRLRLPVTAVTGPAATDAGPSKPGRAVDEAIWSEYRARLLAFVRRRIDDDAAAEDIVHDVLLRAYRGRGSLRDADRFGPWLYQAARNAVTDHYRSRRPTQPVPENLPVEDSDSGRAAVRELARCMRPLVDSLPELYREAIQLSELDGMTQAEAARQLGLTHSGAKSRVQRGRALLAEALLGCCSIELDHRGAVADYSGPSPCGEQTGEVCRPCE
jgi:RNA polymerase sigma-70 factor, ECF subfamily